MMLRLDNGLIQGFNEVQSLARFAIQTTLLSCFRMRTTGSVVVFLLPRVLIWCVQMIHSLAIR